jgi:hypothetical protein
MPRSFSWNVHLAAVDMEGQQNVAANRLVYLSTALVIFSEGFAKDLGALCRDPQDAQLVDTVIRFALSGTPPVGVVLAGGEAWGALQDKFFFSLRHCRAIDQYFETLKAGLPLYYQPQLRLLRTLNPRVVLTLVSFITRGPPPPPSILGSFPPVFSSDMEWVSGQLHFTRLILHIQSRPACFMNGEIGRAPNFITNGGDSGEPGVAVRTGSGGGSLSPGSSTIGSTTFASRDSALPHTSCATSATEESHKRAPSQQDALAGPPQKRPHLSEPVR